MEAPKCLELLALGPRRMLREHVWTLTWVQNYEVCTGLAFRHVHRVFHCSDSRFWLGYEPYTMTDRSVGGGSARTQQPGDDIERNYHSLSRYLPRTPFRIPIANKIWDPNGSRRSLLSPRSSAHLLPRRANCPLLQLRRKGLARLYTPQPTGCKYSSARVHIYH